MEHTSAATSFPTIEAPVASSSSLSPPITPPRRNSYGGRPVSPRSAHSPQETLAVRRFKAASLLTPSMRPRTRSMDDVEAFGRGTGTPSPSDDAGRDPISISPIRYDTNRLADTPNTAPMAGSSSSSSPFGAFKFPPPASSTAAPSTSAAAPVSPLILNFSLKGKEPAHSALSSDESTGAGSEIPGVLVRAATDETVPTLPKGSDEEAEQQRRSGPLKSPRSSQPPPPPSPPALNRSPSHNGYKPALPSPLSTSHTSLSTDAGPAMRRIAEEFPFPASPSTPIAEHRRIDTPRGPSPPTPMGSSPPQAAIPRHLQSGPSPSPPPVARRTRSISGELGNSPLQASSGHWRSASSTSPGGHIFATYEPAPLTPPESTSAGRHLTSASEMAWNDVLGPIGALSFSGIDYSLGGGDSSANGSGKSSIVHVEDLMALEGATPAPAKALPLGRRNSAAAVHKAETSPTSTADRVGNSALMLGSGGGHFGPATRERLADLIEKHVGRIPIVKEDEVVHIVEYGALNSRSASLVPPVISHLSSRHAALFPSSSSSSDSTPSTSSGEEDSSSLAFQVTHSDKVGSDFRNLAQTLETSDSSYLSPAWLSAHDPSLENKVFSSFASRPFAAKVLPRASVSFGFSAMALHWLSTDRKFQMPPMTLAHGELMAFLSSRATEFKPGGLLALAYIGRSEVPRLASPAATTTTSGPGLLSRGTSLNLGPSSSSGAVVGSMSTPGSPHVGGGTPDSTPRPTMRERATTSPVVQTVRRRDIWDFLQSILGLSIQRLVSTNLLKPTVARLLLSMPIHPRTPKQTHAALRAMQHAWTVEEEELLVLPHPAWRGVQSKTISAASYSDHTIQLLKIFYESSMRSVLKDALESRAACEWILETLWTVAKEKVDEEGPQPLELEVQIIALRRKKGGEGA